MITSAIVDQQQKMRAWTFFDCSRPIRPSSAYIEADNQIGFLVSSCTIILLTYLYKTLAGDYSPIFIFSLPAGSGRSHLHLSVLYVHLVDIVADRLTFH